jgi:uncharacterized 2Fe-2S/4Fe-4S cluster protein (DUF4445 family)
MTRVEHALNLGGTRELRASVRHQVSRMVDHVRHGRTLDRGVDIVGNTAMLHLFCRTFMRAIGGFVGSDILAGVMATGLAASPGISVLMGLGTNGEIVVGGREGLLCASTAAGPAFEGNRISCGMRAGSGAISAVETNDGSLHCGVCAAASWMRSPLRSRQGSSKRTGAC